MKVNELRFGNLLQWGDGEITVDLNLLRDFNVYSNNGLLPIDITETWLTKLGFIRDKYSLRKYSIERNDFDFNIDIEQYGSVIGDYDGVVTFKCPEFVHQLQNLYFALTGEELTLNNA